MVISLFFFIPSDLPSYIAVTFEAGVQWHEAYDFVQKQGRFIVGGISPGASVGAAGGWVMGGGHSVASPKFGLGTSLSFPFIPTYPHVELRR